MRLLPEIVTQIARGGGRGVSDSVRGGGEIYSESLKTSKARQVYNRLRPRSLTMLKFRLDNTFHQRSSMWDEHEKKEENSHVAALNFSRR